MKVLQLWRYPVKSMAGERLGESAVDELGLRGDRRWGLVDLDTGKVLTAKREGRLLFARARLVADDQVEVELPDGQLL
ncbi:MAG TPA: MOSC N-terminal beta barrel domain-containing protein, partial [Acidimicrobiales bacterium]